MAHLPPSHPRRKEAVAGFPDEFPLEGVFLSVAPDHLVQNAKKLRLLRALQTAPEDADGVGAHPEDVRHYRVALASAAKRFKRYPPLARERGWEGTAEVAVLLYAAQRRPEVLLIRSSGRDLLDAQAMEMLGQALRVAEVPAGLRGRDLRIELPVRFSLEDER